MKVYKQVFFLLVYTSMLVGACMDMPEPIVNPYDVAQSEQQTLVDSIAASTLPLSHIVSLHQHVFRPTCANSGCHDGTFEPDFRTVESTFNTLVYQPVVKNDPQASFRFRVDPYYPERSVLWERLNHDIDGQSGLMPLVVDPGSEWEKRKDTLLLAIKNWIEAGAPDMFGNVAEPENLPPSVRGAIGFIAGERDPVRRKGGNGRMIIPPGTDKVELYFSLFDDDNAPQEIRSVKLRLSGDRNDFVSASGEAVSLVPSPVVAYGFNGELSQFYHHITIPLSQFVTGEMQYFRIYIQVAGQSELVEIPGDGSADYMKEMFSFQIYD